MHDAAGLVLVSNYDHELRVVPVAASASAQAEQRLRGHQHNVPCVDISPDGQWFASASIDGTCRLWRCGETSGHTMVSPSLQWSGSC